MAVTRRAFLAIVAGLGAFFAPLPAEAKRPPKPSVGTYSAAYSDSY